MRNGYGNSRRKETEKFVYAEEKELNSNIKSPQNWWWQMLSVAHKACLENYPFQNGVEPPDYIAI